MKKIQLKDAKEYEAAKHFGMTALRLHGKEESGCQKFWVGLSYFLPGGGASYASSPTEKVYFVLEGEITIKAEDGDTIKLKKYDSIFIAPNEGREIINETNQPASMLVIVNYPEE